MDLNSALESHVEWKLRFRMAISQQETMDAETIAKDNCCDLGKWLHGEAKAKFGKLASYTRCVDKHATFHVEAGKVARAVNAGKFAEAEAMLNAGSPFMMASFDVGVAIQHLKQEAG